MGALLAALSSLEFLALSHAGLTARFMAAGRSIVVPRGHVFWKTGQSPQGIVVPVGGDVAAVTTDAGGHQICYELVGPGECAGIACAIDGLPHPDEARAIRGGEFFVMERAAFTRFLDTNPDARTDVAAAVGRLFRRSLVERDRMAFLSVNARFARFLLERTCVRVKNGARILLRATHAELAPRLGSVREVVARACSSFIERGLISRTRHGLFVTDRAGLLEAAGFDPGEPPDQVLDADAPARTRRFFIPVLDDGAALAAEARVCAEQVKDFTLCAARGCPVAAARRAMTHAGFRDRAHAADPQPHPAARAEADHREPSATHARSPLEERAIAQRIAAYSARVSTIESRFGDESHVPAS
jgi:CRP-like cAMP-binding protein